MIFKIKEREDQNDLIFYQSNSYKVLKYQDSKKIINEPSLKNDKAT